MYLYFRFRKKNPLKKLSASRIVASWQRTIVSSNIYIYAERWREIDKIWRNESSYIRKISSPFQSIRYFYRGNIFNEMVQRCIRLKNIGSASDITGRNLKLITFEKCPLSKHPRLSNTENIFDGFKKFKKIIREERISNTRSEFIHGRAA